MTPVLHAPPRPPSERRTNGRIPPAPPDFGGDGDDDRERGPRRGLDNLRLAVLFFMGAEAMFFGALISALLVLRLGMAAWPPPLEPRLPIAVTGLVARGRFGEGHSAPVQACAMFWHFVVGVWPVLYFTVYLI